MIDARHVLRTAAALPYSVEAWKCGLLIGQSAALGAALFLTRGLSGKAESRAGDPRIGQAIVDGFDPRREEGLAKYLAHRIDLQQKELWAFVQFSPEVAELADKALKELDSMNSPDAFAR